MRDSLAPTIVNRLEWVAGSECILILIVQEIVARSTDVDRTLLEVEQ